MAKFNARVSGKTKPKEKETHTHPGISLERGAKERCVQVHVHRPLCMVQRGDALMLSSLGFI